MKNPMPVNIKQTHYSFDDDFDLNSFFGFSTLR